ncbi:MULTISPECIES: molybdopterin biosynthesis protein [Halobacterium]|uniref:molybdopterin biosynthesis protein n=1 Tax=Halobacterium TaxID=2239 RepID=UPI00073E602B|nr:MULTISPECIES: molybdopterin biosynthesis protein [Halobacterium]MCG1003885.1 molybdopterin biosynthesis protein [Halobacterium noricense]
MSDRKQFRDLASPEEAHAVIDGLDLSPGVERVELDDADGRVLADRIDARLDVPGFDRAKVDGYAVRAADTFGASETDPVEVECVGDIHAGSEPDVSVGEGTCAEISTGAPVPPGADAVVMVERTARVEQRSTEGASGETASSDGDTVTVRTSLAPGDGVMVAGADVAAGDRVLGPGTVLTSREIGLLAALGMETVPVREKPRVGIVSTGDELVRPGGEVSHRAGQIYDVNSYSIAAAVRDAGGEPVLYPHAGDDYDELARVLRDAADDCDLVLSSGSTSASAVDVVYQVVEERGELLLHGVSVKPGKPMLVGEMGDAAYVGLPGYPVSALTIFRAFVAPKIRDAADLPEPRSATVEGQMAVRERYGEGRTRLMPAGLVESGDGETLVYPVDKGSGATTSLVEADGTVTVDADTEYLDEGETVDVELFSPSVRPPSVFAVGERDPGFDRVLDRLSNPRFLGLGAREGARRLRNGVPDVAVTTDSRGEGEELASWTREWGLVVPAGNPLAISGVADLVDAEVTLSNRTTASGLRDAFDDALTELADERDSDRRTLAEEIDGYERETKGTESPARAVLEGDADAGLALRATADRLGLEFVPVGEQAVRALANPERVEKAGVRELAAVLDDATDVFADLAGYDA